MSRNANSRLVDSLIRHQAYLAGFSKEVAASLQQILAEADVELKNFLGAQLIANDIERQTAKQLKALEKAVAELRNAAWGAARDKLIAFVTELVQYEPEFLRGAVASIQELLAWNKPTLDVIKSLVEKTLVVGRTIQETFASIAQAEIGKLIAQTRIGYLAKQLGGAVWRAAKPIVKMAEPALEAIAATTVSAMADAANALTAKQNPKTFEDKEVWVSVLDSHTTKICFDLNGKVFAVGEGPSVPRHYSCRSNRVPLLVDSDLPVQIDNFETWLETQPEEFRSWLREKQKQFTRASVPAISLPIVQQLDQDITEKAS